MSEDKSRVAKNVSYIAISQIIVLLANVVMLVVLSQVLTPEEFGIVGLGITFLTLFYSLQDLGIMPAIIQRDKRIEESIAVGQYIRWIMAVALVAGFIALSPVITYIYEDSDVAIVVVVMCANMFVLTAGFSSQAILTRSLRFSRLAIASIAQSIIYAVMAIILALLGFSFWSLVLGSLGGCAAYVAVLMHYGNPHIRPKMDKTLAKELWSFGKHILITVLMAFVIFNVDQMIIARALGIAALGFYFVAARFGRILG